MESEKQERHVDRLVEQLRESRSAPAVLKTKLAILRSTEPDVLVFVFEGKDDKSVYYHWITKANPYLEYEPFVCNGKKPLLAFKRSLDRDLGEIKRGVYFFVDRDFDDLCGLAKDESIFMTSTYSFENLLVTEPVLDELLKNEYHCHGEIACRRRVTEMFSRQYEAFLEVTKELNRRLFFARRCKIEEADKIVNSIGKIAEIQMSTVAPTHHPLETQVPLIREPFPEEVEQHNAEFEALEPKARFRGKFAFLFFRKWLDLLVRDRNSSESKLFPALDRENFVVHGVPALDSMAARSSLPPDLVEFLRQIPMSNSE